MNNKVKILTLFLLILSVFLTTGFTNTSLEPKTVYRVYLKGKSLGVIESKSELEKYIDKQQQEIKAKYNVKKVYVPADLEITKEITYKENIKTLKELGGIKLVPQNIKQTKIKY